MSAPARPPASSEATLRNHAQTFANRSAVQGLIVGWRSNQPAATVAPFRQLMPGDVPDFEVRPAALVADVAMLKSGNRESITTWNGEHVKPRCSTLPRSA